MLRWAMRVLGQLIGVAKLALGPSSLRAGGATGRIDQTQNVLLLQHIGRWQNIKTLQRYLQEAVSRLSDWQLSDDAVKRVQRLVKLWPAFKRPPPEVGTGFSPANVSIRRWRRRSKQD